MSAYEEYAFLTSEANNDGSQEAPCSRGMTLRAFFASQAMIGLLAHTEVGMIGIAAIAKLAVRQAQALVNELNATD